MTTIRPIQAADQDRLRRAFAAHLDNPAVKQAIRENALRLRQEKQRRAQGASA